MYQQKLRSLIAFILALVFCEASFAYSSLRIGLMGGLGSAYSNAPDNTLTEDPLSGELFIDYALDDRFVIGVEHQRSGSLAPLATSVSFTGVEMKWYPYSAQPQVLPDTKDLQYSMISMRELAPYFGGGVGFDQSSILPPVKGQKPAAAVGLYINLKTGVDMPLWRQFGARSELGFSMTAGGSGYTRMSYLMLGIYVYL